SSDASERKSLISGLRFSERLPRRIVCSWVTEPNGCAPPRRTASTPAMNVVATAPIPGNSTKSLPSGDFMRRAFFLRFGGKSNCARGAQWARFGVKTLVFVRELVARDDLPPPLAGTILGRRHEVGTGKVAAGPRVARR